jgi:hypothetical protein
VAAVALALGAGPGWAQVPSKCLSGKLKGAGAAAAGQVACESKAAAKGVAPDPECLAKAQAKLQKAFVKAEGQDDCIETGDATVAQEVVDDFVQELKNTLNPPPGVCCAVVGACFYAADATACASFPGGGTTGAEGSVCTGDGSCAPPPAAPGNCCQDFTTLGIAFKCANGTFDATGCGGAGGTFSTGVCTQAGSCQ